MSKRYGRNRKRLALARISLLEGRVRELEQEESERNERLKADNRRLAEKLREQKSEFRALVNEIESVCSYSALLPPQTIGLKASPRGLPTRLKLIPKRVRPEPIPAGALPSLLTEPFDYLGVDLWQVRAYLEEHQSTLARHVHVYLPPYPGDSTPNTTTYAVSEAAYQHWTRSGSGHLSREIYRQIEAAVRSAVREHACGERASAVQGSSRGASLKHR